MTSHQNVDELFELAQTSPETLWSRLEELTIRRQAELALRLDPVRRLQLLLHAPRPMRLVRALPDPDFYLTVRALGPIDALPLLALGSAGQLSHLVDLESWRGDRYDAARSGAWVATLLEAGEPALRRFLRKIDDELLMLLLRKWIRVEQIDYEDGAEVHGHGQSETGTERGFLTPDGYHRFSPTIAEHAPAIHRLLRQLYLDQPDRYQRVLWNALWELPSELEERALAWRQARLEEHGFPNWEEALSIYGAPLGSRTHPDLPQPTDPDGLEAPRAFPMLLPPTDAVRLSLETLPGAERDRALFELLSLSNRILVADSADIGEPDNHGAAIRKAAGYLRIALDARGTLDPRAAGRVLTEVPVIELFREGYALAARLQQRARDLLRGGWPAGHPRATELLDSPIRERIEALLTARPLYVDLADGTSSEIRDFASLAEIEETRVALEMAEVLGSLMVDKLGLELEQMLRSGADLPGGNYRFSALLLTMLAWQAARQELRGDPLPAPVIADFLRTVASRRTAAPDAAPRALQVLLRRLAERFELGPREVAVLQAFGRFCLDLLADECGGLDPGVPVDPRMVACLLVA